MPSPMTTAGLFLIKVIFDLYLLLLIVRLLLCWTGTNFSNPIMQIIFKFTNPLVTPLRRLIRNYRTFEVSTFVIILLIELIKYFLIGVIAIGFPDSILGLFILSLADAFKLLLDTLFYAILLQAIMGWLRAGYTPISELLFQITSPIMRPFQRFIPLVAGIDISPIPVLILLQLIVISLVNPLLMIGTGMTFG